MTHILIVDDEATFARNAALYLARTGNEVAVAGTAAEGRALYAEKPPDIVVLDYRLPDATGLEMIEFIRNTDKTVPIVLITGHGSIELAVEAMKAGANDLLTKPVSLAELRSRVELLAQRQRESSRLNYFESREREASHEILGNSPEMQALLQRIDRIASIDGGGQGMLPPILITGETGTGKELVARACHYRSARRQRPFIEINCAALPATLLETELFGHERGAFTDAKQRKLGLLEAADGGTLFLDEIGDMDLALQAKLLKIIEDGRFRRIGSVQEQQVQVRIVAATNQDLEARVAQGVFRADLYFRLRVLQLMVPPLRQRAGDALLLARHFCQTFAQRYRREGTRLGAAAEAAIARHGWPGNVRELRNLIEQAVMLAAANEIVPAELMLPDGGVPAALSVPVEDGGNGGGGSGSSLDRVEREMLVNAMREAQQNVSRAARQLGISRDTLRYRLEKHGLRV
ncbi:Regulatory protein AtoC [Rubrivivax sp. A210]|uniref:sigma-54-dependent transcriptional regulator n=1 Tax=Rubrivivax sp. A210 TaxID=2772301 RepID=UPI0019189A58|nr:sigma-54 dependent transcriptional regulator [Rubrivivax sp. A210]CAD5371603.1 Regulatory protein AtoC [Rubrivivax sp. A210]